jgi:hypothetical protein
MNDFELFPGKSLSDLFKDIYINQREKKDRIYELISSLNKIIKHAGDMAMIGPIIKDLMDISVKNDESLIKMASIAQRISNSMQKKTGDEGFLSDAEKEQLLKQLEDTVNDVVSKEEEKIDTIYHELDILKQKVTR